MRHSEDILGVVKWAASRVFVLRMKAEYENMDHNLDHREEPHHTDSKEGKTWHSCCPALLSWELVRWAHLRHSFFSPPRETFSLVPRWHEAAKTSAGDPFVLVFASSPLKSFHHKPHWQSTIRPPMPVLDFCLFVGPLSGMCGKFPSKLKQKTGRKKNQFLQQK